MVRGRGLRGRSRSCKPSRLAIPCSPLTKSQYCRSTRGRESKRLALLTYWQLWAARRADSDSFISNAVRSNLSLRKLFLNAPLYFRAVALRSAADAAEEIPAARQGATRRLEPTPTPSASLGQPEPPALSPGALALLGVRDGGGSEVLRGEEGGGGGSAPEPTWLSMVSLPSGAARATTLRYGSSCGPLCLPPPGPLPSIPKGTERGRWEPEPSRAKQPANTAA